MNEKPKRGRPPLPGGPKERDPVVTARLPSPLVSRVDQFAEGRNITRSTAVRELIEAGLDAAECQPKRLS